MIVKELKNKQQIRDIITTPKLFETTQGIGSDSSGFKVDTNFTYLVCTEGKEVLGLFQVRPLNKILLEVHCHILPQYWGTGKSIECAEAGFEYLRNTSSYKKVFTVVPSICIHVLQYMNKIGYKAFGSIEQGIIYNGHALTLFFFEYDLYKR